MADDAAASAAVDLASKTRAAQGLAEWVEDPETLKALVLLLAGAHREAA